MKDKEIKVRVSEEFKEELAMRASRAGLSMSEYIRGLFATVPTKEGESVPTSDDVPTDEEDVMTEAVITDDNEVDDVLEELESSGRVFRGSMFKDDKLNKEVDSD
jgi:antitoxin component of RelBE/YafQ-DinJ toxin-antitoxin module